MKKKDKQFNELKKEIIEAILDRKGNEVVELNLSEIDTAIAKSFILCHGNSTTQVNAIADNVYKEIKDNLGILPLNMEGKTNANWVALDYFDIVVHIFREETRKNYQLEDLWSDALFTEYK